MPSGWRILSVLEEITKDWEYPFTYEDLIEAYDIKMKKDRFVSVHKEEEQLVLNTECNDRGWAQYFVFVEKTSLDLNLDFLKPTERSSSKIKRILEAGHAKRTRHTLGELSGQRIRELPRTPQRVEDLEETMSTYPSESAAQGGCRGRNVPQAEKDARMRRKHGLAPQEATLSSAVDRTEQLHTLLSPEKVGDASVLVHVSSSPPHKQQKTDDAPVPQDLEMHFPTDFLSLTKETRQPLFPHLNQLLFPSSREGLVGTSTLDIAPKSSFVHLYCLQNSLVLRERVIQLAKEMRRLDDVAKNSEAKVSTAMRQFVTVKKQFDYAAKKVDELESQLEEQTKKMEEQAQQLKDQAKQLKEQAQQLEDKAVVIQDQEEALLKVKEQLSTVQKDLDDA
ncbi:uncharacterized protein LOC110704312 [Chenopodium quinoa]|uniref:uncharacterized protein LOC110704312 n=1 Tax=Chenopodium quinoa TaxID=63459 RepID=UPI000B78146E|nr:uncharacterized protein LOC110704312 [Chenopodium quinoa]